MTSETLPSSPLGRIVTTMRDQGASWCSLTPGRPAGLRINGVATVGEVVSTKDVDEIFDAVRRERPRESGERDRVGWMSATFLDERGLYLVTLAEDRAGKRVILNTGTGALPELEQLALSELAAFAEEPAGIIVVGGVGHCGRQKVMHALLRTALRGRRVLGVSAERTRTVEHDSNVWQVDVGEYGRIRHVATFGEAVRLAKAIGADTLALAEVPDTDCIGEVLSAVEREGMLVVARVFGRTVGESIAALGRSANDIERVVDAVAAGVSLRSYFDFEGRRRFVAERVIPNHLMRNGLKKGQVDIRTYYTQNCAGLEEQLSRAVQDGYMSSDTAHTLAAFPESL